VRILIDLPSYYTRGWSGREASVDVTETLAETVIGSSDLPARNKPLYRQCYFKVTHAVPIKLEVITTLNVTVASSISFPPWRNNPLRSKASTLSTLHDHTPHSVGLLWTRDQLVAKTSTWQRTALKRGRHPWRRRDSNSQSLQKSSRRPTYSTVRPLGSVFLYLWCFLLHFSEFYTTNSRNPEILNSVRALYCGLVTWLYI